MMRDEIKGEKIILRQFEKSLAPALFEAANESKGGEFSRWMTWCHEKYSLTESESFIDKCVKNRANGEEYDFAIFDVETNEFCGIVSLNVFNKIHDFCNLGYWVRVSRQKEGIGSVAARLLAQTGFEDLPELNRVEILVAVENIPSRKTAEKSGARFEGVLRNRLKIGDKIHDAAIFSFIRKDF